MIPVLPDSQPKIEQLTVALAEARSELRTCKASLQRAQSALFAIADGLAIVDVHGRISTINPVAGHLTGWKEAESVGRSFSEIVRFIDARGRSVDVIAEGFLKGDDKVLSLRRRDGHVIRVDGTVSEVLGDGKRPIGYVVTFRNITSAARQTHELAFQANHDSLTGLHNRRAFEANLQRAISTAAELGCCHSMLYFDLDRFKSVNDNAGHVAGDELLRQLAVVLRRQLREHDGLARLGGDEFAVLLEDCTDTRAARVAEKIRSAIEEFEFSWDEQVFRIGASIGKIEFSNGDMSAEEIVRLADRMCYVAKTGGRNQVASYPGQSTGAAPAGAP